MTAKDASISHAAILHPNQAALAVQLGLDSENIDSVAATIQAIEAKLGSAAEEECARWFAMSVLRHLRKEKWTQLGESSLDEKQQLKLVAECLAVEGFSTSMRTVTKDARSKFRLVGFASSKKLDRGVLATSTKAYKIAASVIAGAEYLEPQTKSQSKKKEELSPSKSKVGKPPVAATDDKTVVARRAGRRGYSGDGLISVAGIAAQESTSNQAAVMTEEEFADLDAALSKSDAEIIQQNWEDQSNEDRLSRLLGLLAGIGFFVFVALLFL
jgi:hypothetical protein